MRFVCSFSGSKECVEDFKRNMYVALDKGVDIHIVSEEEEGLTFDICKINLMGIVYLKVAIETMMSKSYPSVTYDTHVEED
jgi:hypothetical protein